MPVIRRSTSPTFELPGATFGGLAAPSRGAAETCAWRVRLHPRNEGVPHRVTREEIFIATAGRARVEIDGQRHELEEGDALVVPSNTMFSLGNPFDDPFEAIVVLPVGGAAVLNDGAPFVPPWAQ